MGGLGNKELVKALQGGVLADDVAREGELPRHTVRIPADQLWRHCLAINLNTAQRSKERVLKHIAQLIGRPEDRVSE